LKDILSLAFLFKIVNQNLHHPKRPKMYVGVRKTGKECGEEKGGRELQERYNLTTLKKMSWKFR